MSKFVATQTRITVLTVLIVTIMAVPFAVAQVPQAVPAAEQDSIDKQLFDDLKSPSQDPQSKSRAPAKQSDGEDIGKPSNDRSPFAEIGSQMRQVELRLRQQDMSQATRQLQSDIFARLTQLLDEEEQRQKTASRTRAVGQSKESSGQDGGKTPTENPTGSDQSTGKPSRSVVTPDSINQWSKQIWGVLPDRVQQRMRALGNEQFLPQFEEKIQQYYERLAERNRKK